MNFNLIKKFILVGFFVCMHIYRGSSRKTKSFKPESIHESDLHQFKDDLQVKKVVWATNNKQVTLCHGAFSRRVSYSVYTGRTGRDEVYSTIMDLNWRKKLDIEAKFYLYTLDVNSFQELENSRCEFVSTNETKVVGVKEYKVKDIFGLVKVYELKKVEI